MLISRWRRVVAVAVVIALQAIPLGPVAATDPSPTASPSAEPEQPNEGLTLQAVDGEVIVPYASAGYRYKVVGHGADAGFEAVNFDDTSAGFGDADAPFGTGCGPAAPRTSWSGVTDLLVRKEVVLPAGAADVKVGVAIDNDIQVFWNGVDISGGLNVSEFCAFRDEYVFTVPAELIESGSNLLAARARNRHSAAHLDLQVTAGVDGGAVPRPLIYVHGINGNFQQPGFLEILDALEAEFPSSLRLFEHYQDRGSLENGACAARQAVLPAEPNGGMPVDQASIDGNLCDSQGDLALNAVLLHRDVQQAFEESGNQKVVIVAHSMGAAIARGFLAYSQELGDGVAQEMVDSVVYLQGAQDGSQQGAELLKKRKGGFLDRQLADFALNAFNLDPDRPAGEQLSPRSDWYKWANPDADHLPNLPYFNVYGDINVVILNCFLIFCGDPTTLLSLGDVVMQSGTDDPHDVPAKGGARFLSGALAGQNWQWGMPVDIPWVPGRDPHFIAVGNAVIQSPENHGRFSSSTNEIDVEDCQTHGAVTVREALLNVLRGRMASDPYLCEA